MSESCSFKASEIRSPVAAIRDSKAWKGHRLYGSPGCELRSDPQKLTDLVWGENMADPAPLWCAPKNIGGRHLMPLVFSVERTGKTADSKQAIIALAERRST